jgi:hypothetical protein
MSTVRKKKNIIRRLNAYFQNQGKILTEREYREAIGTPFRLVLIEKFLGPWPRVVSSVKHYYPSWDLVKPEPKVEVVKPRVIKPRVVKNDE